MLDRVTTDRRTREPRTSRGRLLRRVRKFLRLTQRRMAHAMGCTTGTLSFWETGRARMPDQRLDSLLLLVMDAPRDDKLTPKIIHAIREERGR